MKYILLLCILLMIGCETGTGIAAGALGSQTLLGAEEDLSSLEKSLQDQLAIAVSEGEGEKIIRLEKSISQTQLAKQGLAVGKKFLGLDWSDPNAVGTAGGGVVALVLSLLYGRTQHKKYTAHKRGTEKFMRIENLDTSKTLYANIGDERKKLNL